jgi:translation initiation factor 2 alpha subunit (eIF-2alpha)
MKLVKLTNDDFQKSLMKLSEQPLPAKTAFKLKGITKKVKEELTKYEELRNEALKRFGKKREDGSLDLADNGNVQFDTEQMHEFVQYIQEIVNEDVELATLSINDLGDISLTAEELLHLDDLIVE